MTTNRFSAFAPIGLKFHGKQTRTVVRNLAGAARVLLQDWPSDDGEEYVIAVKACVDAITGEVGPEQFRQALLRAASEAGIISFSLVHEAPPDLNVDGTLSVREK
ncbi:hypothetical protein FHX08_002001 [Rhizobium sp. BK529]|uniref:DUF982 domain-containing protein n=1 Tax=unclassified Rhizobium TaxID=2613769 RepID=UPI0010539442|nr:MULTISPECIES: DUF982 domain-containing protein [unclassified Rhizobium]MBB3591657.1 hypothetical protein [Rhizobium sp. BK529]TCS08396.1 uncharacterized protein DUF982 [Rhizobium sp. BK418]